MGAVRAAWEETPFVYNQIFEAIGNLTKLAQECLIHGQIEQLGDWLNENHTLLQEMGVSSPQLDQLVIAARDAGALGAKLSGGGRGGNMIALATAENTPNVSLAIRSSGAINTITTQVNT